MIMRCPKQWEYRYVEGLKIPPSGALILGSAWHKGIEHNYRQKIDTGEDLPLSEVTDCFADAFDERAKQDVVWESKKGELKDLGVTLSRIHHTKIAPHVHPQHVEKKFTITLNNKHDVVGIYDLIDVNGAVVDNKSYKRKPTQADVDTDIQLGIYAYAYEKIFDTIPDLRFDVVTKTKIPKALQMTTKRNSGELEWIGGLLQDISKYIQSGIFYPNPNGWHCSKKWCGYWDKCKNGR